jgi:hypothetical protein
MKFSNAALAALQLAAFMVSRTKAASTTGLTIADGMVVELCEGSNITVDNEDNFLSALVVGDGSSNGGASLTITGGSYKSINYGNGMEVNGGAVVTVLGGTIQGGEYGGGMAVYGAVATVCDGTIQARTNYGLGFPGVYTVEATVRIAGGIIIGGNYTFSSGGGFFNENGDATITGGTFKGGFSSMSGDQAPSLVLACGNTSIYGGTYEGNWTNYPDASCYDSYTDTKVYGKDLVVKDNHLVGTLCDGNTIDVNILGYSGEPITVNIVNNCASFPVFDECGGKGGKSGKKTKSSLFRP